MARYYALSTTNAQTNGWHVEVGPKAKSADAAAAARMDIRRYNTGLERDTLLKNLVVVPSSHLRRYGLSENKGEE